MIQVSYLSTKRWESPLEAIWITNDCRTFRVLYRKITLMHSCLDVPIQLLDTMKQVLAFLDQKKECRISHNFHPCRTVFIICVVKELPYGFSIPTILIRCPNEFQTTKQYKPQTEKKYFTFPSSILMKHH